jgi:hypothetical protein
MTPNSTNASRNIENVKFRAAGNGARIRNLRTESSRNHVSMLNLVHRNAISRAMPVGAPRQGHQSGPGSGQGATSVLQKQYREPPIANSVEGLERNNFNKAPAFLSLCWFFLGSPEPDPTIGTPPPSSESGSAPEQLQNRIRIVSGSPSGQL